MTVIGRIAFATALALPAQLRAQDAGADAGVRSPESIVAEVRAGRTPVLAQTRRSRVEETVALRPRLDRGRCYALVGAAQGASQVRAQVRIREAPDGPPMALANSAETAAQGRFCVTEAPELYRVDVESLGAAWWHVEVFALDTRAADAPRPAVYDEAAPSSAPATRFAVGGVAQDYLAAQLRGMAGRRAGAVGFTDVQRRRLDTNAVVEGRVALPAERCVDLLAAGVPSVSDLVLELEDPSGQRVASDGTHRGSESARFCTRVAGTYAWRVRVFLGAGDVAAQLVIEP